MKHEIEESIFQIELRMAALRAMIQFGEEHKALGPEMSRYLDDLQSDLKAERHKLKEKLKQASH